VLGEAVGEADPAARQQAIGWLRRAAEVAAGARGMTEAAAHLRAAIELSPPSGQPDVYRRLGEIYGAGDRSLQAFASAWQIGEVEGRSASFLLDALANQLMVTCRWFGSVARQPTAEELEALIERGR